MKDDHDIAEDEALCTPEFPIFKRPVGKRRVIHKGAKSTESYDGEALYWECPNCDARWTEELADAH